MIKVTHVILCGGAGTRLWPLSNSRQPKQLLRLFNGKSLLQLAAERNVDVAEKIIAVSSASIAEEVKQQLDELDDDRNVQVLEEPVARNTAAAIAITAFLSNPEDVLLVTPSDHLVGTPDLYRQAIDKAIELAGEDFVVTFGLAPLYPETGYGYIQFAGNDVIRFAEKPSILLAESFVASGDYLWNSGIFCFKAGVMLSELKKYAPEIYIGALKAANEYSEHGIIGLETMANIPSDSIDYAVMENSKNVKVVPTNMEWSDVGSFEALSEALLKRYQHKNKEAVFVESQDTNNIVIGDQKMVALVGVEDLVVVNTPDAILIMKKGSGQHIKKLYHWVKENRPLLV